MKIKNISAIQILDSRGNPTIETNVELENGIIEKASVPSGASTGTHEAFELRDNNPEHYEGKGVLKAIENINTKINELLKGQEIENPAEIDQLMIDSDATENKQNLGANAILSVSLATFKAYSKSQNKPLWKTLNEYYFQSITPNYPRLMINIINGGKHANWNFDIQEFIISPRENLPSRSVEVGSEVFHSLGKLIKEKGLSTTVGDEGGYSPALNSNIEVFELIQSAIKKSNNSDVDLAIDVAASEFFKNNQYFFQKENKFLNAKELTSYYQELINKFNLISIEDPFFEDSWEDFAHFTKNTNPVLVVGDDLYTTNKNRLQKGIDIQATSAILIKPNQIGTLFETVETIKLAKTNNLKVIISHRSGETEDSFIADLSFACAANFLKSGSVNRSERLAKYNRLIEIEQEEI